MIETIVTMVKFFFFNFNNPVKKNWTGDLSRVYSRLSTLFSEMKVGAVLCAVCPVDVVEFMVASGVAPHLAGRLPEGLQGIWRDS